LFLNQLTFPVEIALKIISFGLLIPILVLFIECCAALLPRRPGQDYLAISRPRIGVLIPAHNEALVIETTLKSILAQLTPQDQLVVIADNCDDDTVAIARATGATVVERQDLDRRGKGYALDYGLKFLATTPPDVVIVIDADCVITPNTVERISRIAIASKRPVQAAYLIDPPLQMTPKDAISSLAIIVKNLVRPQGLAYLRCPCLLTGTGMAFPWSVISEASLASSNIVEDMQLAVDLAIAGYPTVFCPEAYVKSVLPQQQHATQSQRTRWEHGHLQTIKQQVPRLLYQSFQQKRVDLLALALDLSIPPLSLLTLLWSAATIIALLAIAVGVSWLPVGLLAVEGVFLIISITIALTKFSPTKFPLHTLLSIPFYILWKIPLYLAFITNPETKWKRTDRDTTNALN
jgi:cellulose synthase/poly-beta-1,6-N-acetylglucosamine synthase-like glycosyltransferase